MAVAKVKDRAVKKMRVDLSKEDFARLDHIGLKNALKTASSCRFAINRLAHKLVPKYRGLADDIDAAEEKNLIPWGFECDDSMRALIEVIKSFYNLKYLSSVIRLSIRVQAEIDDYEGK